MDNTSAARRSVGISPPSREETPPFLSLLSLRERIRARNAARCTIAALAFLTLSACGNIEPWVKPYERQALADPIMSFDLNPVSSAYIDHVYEAREGARGALGSGGGDCGCN